MLRRLALPVCALTGCYAGTSGNADDAGSGVGTETAATDPSAGSDGESAGESAGDTGDGSEDDGDEFGRAQLRRLTHAQFERSIHDLLGETIVVRDDLDPDLYAELFSTVGASMVTTSSVGVERYETAALDAAHQAFADPDARATLVGCDPVAEPACAGELLARLGRRAWRRPLDADELARYEALVTGAPGAEGDPWLGLELAVAALLQSPNFLYLVEIGEPDPDAPARTRYTDWEMAGRLAAFVWASAPDDELLDAAAAGELSEADEVLAQAERMLADPRADAALGQFFGELLHFDAVDSIAKDPAIFPEANAGLFAAMRGEGERMVAALLADDADVRDLFDTRRTFVTAELAELYGMDAPDPATMDADGFAPVTIPDDWARAGFFGTGVFLASGGTVTRTSPTKRGNFVQRRLRCTEVPPPPDDVDAQFPPASEDDLVTMRERLEIHRENPTCAGCHDLMDPIGLSLEHFDGIGRHRDDDRGLALDVTAEIDGVAFEGLTGLAATLREDPATARCLAGHAYRFAIGHADGVAEIEIVGALAEGFDADGYRFGPLVRAIVASEGFRFRGRAEEP